MLAQILLVILIGVYFIRTTWFLFGVFSPLTPVAGIVLTICLLAFHKPPTATGAWFYTVIAMCVIGAIANFTLLYSTSPTYQNPTNQAFSWTSMISFVLLAGTLLWQQFGLSS
ncbi:MAG: hypothetical protein ACRCY3_10730 [Sphingorhabdus sp.]